MIIAAVKRLKAAGKPIDRHTVRDAIQATRITTLLGPTSFDQYGDLTDRTVSIFQFHQNPKGKPEDLIDQAVYIGTAPQA